MFGFAVSGGYEMNKWIGEALRNPNARITGAVYLLYFLTAIFAEVFVSQKLIVYGDATNIVAYLFYSILTLLFYLMFKPVSRGLSLFAALVSLAGCAVGVLGLFSLAPTQISPLLFFGFYCLLIGYLIFRSTFLPRILGALMAFAGLGWLLFMSPPIARDLSLCIEVLGVVAEATLMLWLLVMGVNVRQWKEQTIAAEKLPSFVSAVRVRSRREPI